MNTESYQSILQRLYGEKGLSYIETALATLNKGKGVTRKGHAIRQHDICLVSYADSFKASKGSPLQALHAFVSDQSLDDVFSLLHLLPFYPWDTDRGFSVIDYYKVAPDAGTWDDIAELSMLIRLMFDFVANHASVENPLIQAALIERHMPASHPQYEELAPYKEFVLAYSEETRPDDEDLVSLSRPRKGSVMSPYVVYEKEGRWHAQLLEKSLCPDDVILHGHGYVWTTFTRPQLEDGSEGTRQVDLNFKNPAVFVEAFKIMLFYVEQRASHIRLDAIGYLWKKLGSYSLHEAETHDILYCWYRLLQEYAPEVVTIAEVNEPQQRVFSYLGTAERPESDVVYQFTHFPLALYSLHFGDTHYYREWLKTLPIAAGRQFITILGSHDGMGMKPILGILPEERLDAFSKHLVKSFDGLPNYATLPGGRDIIYEVCGTPWSLINGNGKFDAETALRRYCMIVNMGLLVRGLPAIYINGLLASPAYQPEAGLDENRTVNREQHLLESIQEKYADGSDYYGKKAMKLLCSLLRFRASHPAFDPGAPTAEPLDSEKYIIAARLYSRDKQSLYLYGNVDKEERSVSLQDGFSYCNAITKEPVSVGTLRLQAYESIWLEPLSDA